MQTKLTLRMDAKLIRHAKAESRRSGRSVSRLVADYFKILGAKRARVSRENISPRVRELIGCIKGVDESDYKRYLEEKYL